MGFIMSFSWSIYEILRTDKNIELTIFATGSEVNLAIEVSHKLATQNIYSKVISVPSLELFNLRKYNYKKEIMNETKYKISIEAGITSGWERYTGNSQSNALNIGIDSYGESAPGAKVAEHFGLTLNHITDRIKSKFS